MVALGLELSHCMLKVPESELMGSSRLTNGLGVFDKTCPQNLNTTLGLRLDERALPMTCCSVERGLLRGGQDLK